MGMTRVQTRPDGGRHGTDQTGGGPLTDEPGRALMQAHRAPMSPLVLSDGAYFSSGRFPGRELERRLEKAHAGVTHA